MFRTQNLCPGSKNVFDSRQKHFLFSEQQNLFPQHVFTARLNWETFASATMFPSLARPLVFVERKLRPCVSKKNCLPFNENFPAENAYRLLEPILATKYSRHKLIIDRTQR